MLTKMRFERLRTGVKGYEMAKLTNLCPSAISAIERRKITVTKERQEQIARTLNFRARDLFEDNGLAAVVEED